MVIGHVTSPGLPKGVDASGGLADKLAVIACGR